MRITIEEKKKILLVMRIFGVKFVVKYINKTPNGPKI